MFQVLESSKRNLSEERPQSVIAELAPALLGDDVAASRALRSDRKTFLDALQMLQVRITAIFINIMLDNHHQSCVGACTLCLLIHAYG